MNRIPGILLIVMLIAIVIRVLPKYWKGAEKVFRYVAFPAYILGILYLTIFSRFLSPREIYNLIFNMGYTPTESVIVGNRGSEWLAGKQGVRGIRLLLVGLSDPNSELYIIPSCLMNLLLFLPLGMLFRFVVPSGKKDRLWTLVCAGFVLLIECIQYFFGLGQFDILDVLFNTAGFIIGRKIYDHWLCPWAEDI